MFKTILGVFNFKIQCNLCFLANEMAEVSPNDALKTVRVFNFNTQFVNNLTEEHEQINKIGQYRFLKADPNIKSVFLKRKDVLDAIIHIILLDNYTIEPLETPEEITENVLRIY